VGRRRVEGVGPPLMRIVFGIFESGVNGEHGSTAGYAGHQVWDRNLVAKFGFVSSTPSL